MEQVNYLVTSSPDQELFGGKGSNLISLIRIGANVPPGYIISTKSYEIFIQESKNYAKLCELFSHPYSSREVIEHSAKIIELIMETQIPNVVIEEIKRGYILLNEPNSSFAVRSSALIEDSKKFSFAGQANTYLFQRSMNDLIKSVKRCWASLFSPQALLYFLHIRKYASNFSLLNIKMAVIIQKMINSHVSGVLFTSNVLTNDDNQMLINLLT